MKKDFTIDAEVRLFAHWPSAAKSPEEQAKRVAIDDKLGSIAARLDEPIKVLVEGLTPAR